MYEETASDREAAVGLGIPLNTFRSWRARAGLAVKPAPRDWSSQPRLSEREDRRRRQVWRLTESDYEAAWFLGIAPGSFHQWREVRGIPNKWTGRNPGQAPISQQEERRRLDAWASSASLREAAGKLGLLPQTMDAWARRRGIPSQAAAQTAARLGYSEHELRTWEAFCNSLSDLESANRLGVGRNSMRRWRIRHGFTSHKRSADYWQRLKHEARNGNPVAAFYVRKRFPQTHGLEGKAMAEEPGEAAA